MTSNYRYILCLLTLFLAEVGFAQMSSLTFSTVEQQMKVEPKPLVVFLHTDWCNYCALMEKKTFSNPVVQDLLKEKVYFISFNAETKEAVTFQQHSFVFKKKGMQGGVHELAEALSSKNAYPALIVLNEKYEIMYQHHAYVGPKEMLQLLKAL